METVNCDLCGADDAEFLFAERDLLHRLEGTFRLVRCRQCGLMYINPRPTRAEIGRYYPGDYCAYEALYDHPSRLVRADHRYGVSKRARAVVARLEKNSGRLLDVGCSTGGFLDEMRRRGDWEPYGVEVDAEAARYGRERLGLEVFAGTLHEAAYADDFFDLVTLWNVLEHLHRPQATLVEIARVIRPGGLLVVAVPNPDCVEARLFGPYWAGWDAPRHLYVYPRPVLERALAQAGFGVTEVATFTGRHQVLALSLGNWVDDRVRSERWRRWLKRAARSLPARLLTLPYYAVADHWNRSSVVTVFARRQ
ncbi:MAG: class I SAM-dependent methyltransferase [Anaerolineae bacterium]|nr:class I SAM-dependent methyltransferase [Anaerolineae bacterium]